MNRCLRNLGVFSIFCVSTACGAIVQLDSNDAGSGHAGNIGGATSMAAAGSGNGVALGGQGNAGSSGGATTHSTAGWGVPLNSVSWTTGEVSLSADGFAIVANNYGFLGNPDHQTINSNPSSATYTTLELVWHENGREMRLFIYFSADATHWWSNEIRTYDGQLAGDWIYYYGDFFEQPLGTPFIGDLVLQSNGPSDTTHGTIYFLNLRLLPTFTQ